MNSTSVVFNADSGQYVTNVEGMEKATVKVANTVADTKNKILAYGKQQVESAKAAGASATELEKIWTQTTQRIAKVTENNAAAHSRAVDGIIEQNKRLAASQKEVSNVIPFPVAPPESHGDEITNKQRASAVLRGGGIRAGETFLTQFEVFNKLSSIAFPALGLATLVTEAGHAVAELKEMYDTAQKLPEALRQGFESLNAPLELSIDGLRKANDELDITNAKLAHKPSPNGTALALDEARINADRLAESARKAQQDVAKLLQENRSSFLSEIFLHKGNTGEISDEVNKRMKTLADLQQADKTAVRSGKDTPQAQDTRAREIENAQNAFLSYIRETRAKINGTVESTLVASVGTGFVAPRVVRQSYAQVNGDQSANNAILNGTEDYLYNIRDDRSVRDRNAASTVENKRLEAQKAAATQTSEAQRKAQEAARKAMETQRKGWEQEDDSRKLSGSDTPTQDINVFDRRLAGLKVGSEQYIYVQHQLAEAIAKARSADAEAARKAEEKQQRDQRSLWDLDHDEWVQAAHRTAQDEADYWDIRSLEAVVGSANYVHAENEAAKNAVQARKDREAAEKAQTKARYAAGENETNYAQAKLNVDVQTGQVSRQSAALQEANIHAEQFRQTMVKLQEQLAQATNDHGASSAEAIGAQDAIDKASADRRIQIMQDAANTAATTWQGALRNADALWVQDAMDSAKQVEQLFNQTIDGLNDNLSNLLTGQKTNFAGYFQGLGKTIATDGLKRLEAPVLGALGIGKPDGSDSNPYSVKVVGGSGGGSFLGGLAGTKGFGKMLGLGGGDDDDDSSDDSEGSVSSGFGKVVSFLGGLFGGGHALGGDVKAGVPIDVGEMGREKFVPSVPGKIIPNNQLGGSTAYYSINVGEGVTGSDVDMRIRSALREVHPRVVSSSVGAMKDDRRRLPASKG